MEAYAQSVPVAAGVPKAFNPVIIGKFAKKGDLSSLIDPAAGERLSGGLRSTDGPVMLKSDEWQRLGWEKLAQIVCRDLIELIVQ